eukprot:TRINITY_DN19513_c0_g1_i1.p1 TRINITY_DN19513_c0_g1~~TRINITY_DN19513_c0_g1_i1.p1  ORF type:complete len:246 (-),score=43.10 TRINITY_DN19513_c0_g1_i1:117-854(-)
MLIRVNSGLLRGDGAICMCVFVCASVCVYQQVAGHRLQQKQHAVTNKDECHEAKDVGYSDDGDLTKYWSLQRFDDGAKFALLGNDDVSEDAVKLYFVGSKTGSILYDKRGFCLTNMGNDEDSDEETEKNGISEDGEGIEYVDVAALSFMHIAADNVVDDCLFFRTEHVHSIYDELWTKIRRRRKEIGDKLFVDSAGSDEHLLLSRKEKRKELLVRFKNSSNYFLKYPDEDTGSTTLVECIVDAPS